MGLGMIVKPCAACKGVGWTKIEEDSEPSAIATPILAKRRGGRPKKQLEL